MTSGPLITVSVLQIILYIFIVWFKEFWCWFWSQKNIVPNSLRISFNLFYDKAHMSHTLFQALRQNFFFILYMRGWAKVSLGNNHPVPWQGRAAKARGLPGQDLSLCLHSTKLPRDCIFNRFSFLSLYFSVNIVNIQRTKLSTSLPPPLFWDEASCLLEQFSHDAGQQIVLWSYTLGWNHLTHRPDPTCPNIDYIQSMTIFFVIDHGQWQFLLSLTAFNDNVHKFFCHWPKSMTYGHKPKDRMSIRNMSLTGQWRFVEVNPWTELEQSIR